VKLTRVKHLNRDQGLALIDKFLTDNLSIKEFCAKEDISYDRFMYWKKTHKRVRKMPEREKFLPVKLVSVNKNIQGQYEGLKITLGSDISIDIPKHVDRTLFKDLLEVCFSKCG